MYQTISCGALDLPQAFIAIKKNRVKHYNGEKKEVYLNGNTEFQIELFNPTNVTVLAEIFLNDKRISYGGVVIYPGQRIFLDRYINENRKFKFTTYEIDGNNNDALKAIENNGKVTINFYNEEVINYGYFSNNLSTNTNKLTWTTTCDAGVQGSVGHSGLQDIRLGDSITTSASTDCYYTSYCSNKLGLETGVVEKGGLSDQEFVNVNKSFSSFPITTTTIQILPISRKPITYNSLMKVRKYCSNCGKKVSPKDKYCSSCGEKL